MSPVWSALIGAVAALVGVWVTQALTNRREFQRDQLKWAQERQQRELDSQKVAFAEFLLALDKWHTEVYSLSMHLLNNVFRRGDVDKFPQLEETARGGLVAVQLLCSEEAIEVTYAAFSEVFAMSFAAKLAADSAQDGRADADNWRRQVNEFGSKAHDKIIELRKVYRAELAGLVAEPVVLSGKSRKWHRLPWRKPDTSA
jgi:hypothetical protein